MSELFSWKGRFEAPADEVFGWHEREGAFQRLSAPFERVRLVERTGALEVGARTVVEVSTLGPFRQRIEAQHVACEPPRRFVDVHRRGPFAEWTHQHLIEPDGADACTLEDRIEYRLPFGAVGRLVGGRLVRRRLAQVFRYRHELMAQDLAAHRAYRARGGGPLRVALSGAGGTIGSALAPFLTTGGHSVVALVRDPARVRAGASVHWDPARGVDPEALAGVDAVVHLAGEGIAGARWTPAFKRRILESRADATGRLCASLAAMDVPPRVLVCASATGFYGDTGDEVVDESGSTGEGFLARVCRDWEDATRAAAERGIRVVNLRIGVVMSATGGALALMAPVFRLGLGGALGRGRQWLAWVDRDDVVRAVLHALGSPELAGPVNVVSPWPVRQVEHARTLARVLCRPALVRVPAPVLRAALGEMADEMLLAGQRVRPAKLIDTGFAFGAPALEHCLRKQLGRAPVPDV